MGRTAFRVALAAALAGCSGGDLFAANAKGAIVCAPMSASLGPCCGKVALEIAASKLPVSTCSGSSVYAVCDGSQFVCEYVCDLPAGYTVQTGTAKACPDEAGIPDAPSSLPVPFDAAALRLGPCSGNVVALVPAGACPDACPGALAYAVCRGGAYGACACDIPAGFTLVGLSDGGSSDARAKPD